MPGKQFVAAASVTSECRDIFVLLDYVRAVGCGRAKDFGGTFTYSRGGVIEKFLLLDNPEFARRNSANFSPMRISSPRATGS